MEIIELKVQTGEPKELGTRAIVCDEKGVWHMCVWALRFYDGAPKWYNEKGYRVRGCKWAVLPYGSKNK